MIKCNKAGTLDGCAICYHAEPHEHPDINDAYQCGRWGECWDGGGLIKVRCVKCGD